MNKIYRFLLAILVLFAFTINAQNAQTTDWVKMMQDPEVNFYDVQKAFNTYYTAKKAEMEQNINSPRNERGEVKVPGFKLYKRWEWFNAPRCGPNGERFDPSLAYREMTQYKKQNGDFMAGNWSYIGPPNVTNMTGAGRCNFVRVHPTTPTTIYTGSPSGGLWVSTNSGVSWSSNTDNLDQVIGCTDIAIDPTNTQIMYMATGDGDAGDNNTVGLLKSIDGGTTWLPTGLSFAPAQYRQMSKVLIDPTNTSNLLVCTSGGIYKSTDAAVTWTLAQAGSFKDMELNVTNSQTVYAVGGQFYRSTNFGTSWTNITTGLPTPTQVSRMAIATTAADANYLYIIAGLPAPNYGTQGFYRSTDGGTTWTLRSTPNIGNQQWYDLCVASSPTNRDEVILGGQTQFLRSTNGGTSWANNGAGTHVDYHDILFTGSTTYWIACDGGVYRTTNSGGSWTEMSNNLQIAQMYGFGHSATTANLNIQGWQDNGTSRYNGTWQSILGGDGMLCFIARTNDLYMWAEYYNGAMNRSTNGGASFSACATPPGTAAWVCPWKESPTIFNTIYTGFQNLYRSTNGGTSWTALGTLPGLATETVTQFAVHPANVNVIWVAKGSTLYKTTNNGVVWTTITTLPPGNISYIATHNTDQNKAWVTYSGYTNSNKVYQTTDQGVTWTNLSPSLPNIPINCITFKPGGNDDLYIGTDAGVFFKDGAMSTWQPFSTGLPNVVVTQIEIFNPTNKLRCSTYGRGLWESDFYVPGNYAPVANFAGDQLIACPGAAVQFTDYSPGQPTTWAWTFPGGSPATSSAQNPLVIYSAAGTYAVTLTVSNSTGTDTATFTNYITIATSPYAAPTTTPDSVCAPGGIVNLVATPSQPGTVRWWDAPGGGNLLATGNTYSPNITATTTYWVDETFPSGSTNNVGPVDYTIGAGSMFVANDIRGLYFDVLTPVIINSVDVFSNSAGNRTIEIIDPQGNTYLDTTIFIPASPATAVTVPVNFKVYPGTNYFIKCRGLVDLYRNSSGAVYPYTSPSINITNSNAGSPGYYYFFYFWDYTDIVCNTGRNPVTGTVYTCSSVEELFANGSFMVYPNPNFGTFDLSFETINKDDYTIKVMDAIGKVIYEEKANDFSGKFSKKIDITAAGKGVYMIEVSNGKNESIKKIVVY